VDSLNVLLVSGARPTLLGPTLESIRRHTWGLSRPSLIEDIGRAPRARLGLRKTMEGEVSVWTEG
jgi:hypothetical protein